MIDKIKDWIRENPHCLALTYGIFYLAGFFALETRKGDFFLIDCPLDDVNTHAQYTGYQICHIRIRMMNYDLYPVCLPEAIYFPIGRHKKFFEHLR